MAVTKIEDLVNPTVMADMISAKIDKAIVVTPFAKIDKSLVGVAGNKIQVPQYAYIGDASDVSEGNACDTSKLGVTTVEATVKKAMKAVELTDEAVLSAFGNPVGEANNQLAKAVAGKVDADAIDALCTAQKIKFVTDTISYLGVVDAIDLFNEEVNVEKVMFVHPSQVTQLRHDSNFISRDKYTGEVVMTGEIGMIANCRIIPSKRVKKNSEAVYILTKTAPTDWATSYTSYYTASTDSETGVVTYSAVTGESAPTWAPNTYFEKVSANNLYLNPIVQLKDNMDDEDESPAVTIFLKRDTNVESERQTLKRLTDISVDKFYAVALTNQSKVVLAAFGV